MRKLLATLLILGLALTPCYSQEVLSSFDEKNLPVLNEELRSIKSGLFEVDDVTIEESSGVLTLKLAPVADGGTGQDFSATAQGNVLYFSATGTVGVLAPGDDGQMLKTQGAAANPVWVTVTDDDTLPIWEAEASDTIRTYDDAEEIQADDVWVKKKEIQVFFAGIIRIKFDYARNTETGTAYARVYIDGVATGTEKTSTTTTYATWSQDIAVETDDLVQLYVKHSHIGQTTKVRNFRFYFNATETTTPSSSTFWKVN